MSDVGSIKTKALESTLASCDELFRKELYDSLEVDDVVSVCKKITHFFYDSDDPIEDLIDVTNAAITEAVERAQSESELNHLHDFIGAVAVASVQHKVDWNRGSELRIQGEQNVWGLRLAIDAASRKLLMTSIEAKTRSELEVSPSLSVQIPETKCDPGDAVGRLYEVVTNLVAETFLSAADQVAGLCPDPRENEQKFEEYCVKINGRLRNTNGSKNHIFTYTLRDEPQEIVTRLLELLPHLRFFICSGQDQSYQILSVESKDFEGWLAHALYQIKEKITEYRKRSFERKEAGNKMVNNVFNVGSVAGDLNNAGRDVSTSKTVGNSDEVSKILAELIEKVDVNDKKQQKLKKGFDVILAHQKKSGEVPDKGKSWLKQVEGVLKVGDPMLKLVKSLISLV